jgi:tetratricopeptide (TPR) repeat protein
MEFDALGRMAEADLLKIDTEAHPGDIQRAYEERRREWSIKRNLVEQERSLIVKVDQIQARLDRAYRQMLSEKEAPSLSNAAAAEWSSPKIEFSEQDILHQHAPPPAPESVESVGSSDEPSAEIDVEAEIDIEIETETGEHDTPSSLPPLIEDEPEEASFIQTGVEPEMAPMIELDVDVADATPSDTRPHVAESSAQAELVEEDAQEDQPIQEMPAAQRRERVRQLFRDTKLHFQVQDWEGAISLLFELVELAPNNAAYHGMLAKAMLRHPVMRKNAERHFIEALRLAPQDADLHFWLGLYYKTFGMRSRAETEFRTVLRIDPRHEGARKYLLGDGKKKDPLRDVFRKIFG